MTGIDHELSALVEVAAQWLADQNPHPRPAIPALQARFGLTPVEACEAVAMARRIELATGKGVAA